MDPEITKDVAAPAAQNGTSKPLSVDDRIAALRAEKDAREKARAEAGKLNEAEILELEAKFETEAGVRGIDFDIENLAVYDEGGNFVGRLGPPIVLKRQESSIIHRKFVAGKITEVTAWDYVKPHVVAPSPEDFRAILDKHPVVLTRCANRLVNLYGSKTEERAGK